MLTALLLLPLANACTCRSLGVMLANNGGFQSMDGSDVPETTIPDDPHLWLWIRLRDPNLRPAVARPMSASFVSDGGESIPAEVVRTVKGAKVNLEIEVHPIRPLPSGSTWTVQVKAAGGQGYWRSGPLHVEEGFQEPPAPTGLKAITSYIPTPDDGVRSTCDDDGNRLSVGDPSADETGSLYAWEARFDVPSKEKTVTLVVPGGPLGFALLDQSCSPDPFLMRLRGYTPWPLNAYIRFWPFDAMITHVEVRRLGPTGSEGGWMDVPVELGVRRPADRGEAI